MYLRILGQIEVVRDGQVIVVAGARRRSLLATLALDPGRTISFDRLIDAVWDEAPPATARNTVQVHVAALRKVLGIPEYLISRDPGYQLRLPSPGTDLVSFRQALAEVAAASGPHQRLPMLAEALALWRGNALADVALTPYLSRYAASLDELYTTTREDLLADRLRVGQHQDTIAELELLGSEHPFRERTVRLLMTALYRDGRASEAIRAYDALRDRLRDELGVEPARQTASIGRRIVRADPSLLAPPAAIAG